VGRLEIGLKLQSSVASSPAFFSNGVICPSFSFTGKRPLLNEALAILVIMETISGKHSLSSDIGRTSRGDDWFGSFFDRSFYFVVRDSTQLC